MIGGQGDRVGQVTTGQSGQLVVVSHSTSSNGGHIGGSGHTTSGSIKAAVVGHREQSS